MYDYSQCLQIKPCAMHIPVRHTCRSCGETPGLRFFARGSPIQMCCPGTYYCNVQCQRDDYERHKRDCYKLQHVCCRHSSASSPKKKKKGKGKKKKKKGSGKKAVGNQHDDESALSEGDVECDSSTEESLPPLQPVTNQMECPICYEPIDGKEDVYALRCCGSKYVVHHHCREHCLQFNVRDCPMCRASPW